MKLPPLPSDFCITIMSNPSSNSYSDNAPSPTSRPTQSSLDHAEALRSATALFAAIDTVLDESASCPTLNFGSLSSRSSLAWNDAEPMMQHDALSSKSKPQRLRKTKSLSETDLSRLVHTKLPSVFLDPEKVINNESTHSFRGEFDAQSV